MLTTKNTIKYLLSVALVALSFLVSSCHRNTPEDSGVTTMADSSFYICIVRPAYGSDTIYIERKYSLCWPEGMSEELQKEILSCAFGDTTGDFYTATDAFLDDLMLFEDDTLVRSIQIEKTEDAEWTSYEYVTSDYKHDKNLYRFSISYENYIRYGAHGLFGTFYITYDRDRDKIVRLTDLLDTAQLSPLITQAIVELKENEEVMGCVYSLDMITATDNFYIDNKRQAIVLVYQVYEIASFADGIQEVILPIQWLTKHLELTEYGKGLLN